jgi:hypothetical protein
MSESDFEEISNEEYYKIKKALWDAKGRMTERLIRREKGKFDLEFWLEDYGSAKCKIRVNEENYELYPSFAMSNCLNDLIEALYYLYPENNISYSSPIIEYELINRENGCFIEIPKEANFIWDEEGTQVEWKLERKPTLDTEFNIIITIILKREEEKILKVEIPYKELCYIVAEECRSILQIYGLNGYTQKTQGLFLNVQYYLFIKAVALEKLELLKVDNSDIFGYYSSFQKEIELLEKYI